jgi:hypothetical protein
MRIPDRSAIKLGERRSLLRREEGQAAFEFLLVLPFVLLIILLLVDFGILTYEYVTISAATRDAARYGSVNCDTSSPVSCSMTAVKNRAIARTNGFVATGDPDNEVEVAWINRSGTADNKERGDSIVVKVTHDYDFLFFPGVSIPVVSCADMRLERTENPSNAPGGGVTCE